GIPKRFEAKIPLHPDHPEWGIRTFPVQEGSAKIVIQSADAESLKKGEVIRLMNLFNVEALSKSGGRFHSEGVAEAKERGARIIQWMPADLGRGLEVVKPDASRDVGVVDPPVLSEKLPSTFQFYRYGFVRVYNEEGAFRGYYAHG
ncbi:MAG: glutamate--tRNA ligase, partial [Candidatus Methanomethylicia archaeon]|nr:glutamate--tRNA ligase [Candidatus Methanomethylicia archaeon]